MRFSCFPLVPDIEVMLRHSKLMRKDSICHIISFQEDAEKLRTLERTTGIPCTVSISEGLTQTDALLLLDNDLDLRWEKYYACIDFAVSCGLPIFASRSLIEQMEDDVRKAHLISLENIHELQLTYMDERLCEIKTPIVTVMGMGKNCGKFECQLELKEQLDAAGYRSTWLCSNSLGSRMGMYALPFFLFDSHLAFPEKVIAFNRYVHDLCVANPSDILIIGVPSGIGPLAEKDTNYFAEIPLIISAALNVYYSILTFYYRLDVHNDFLEWLSRYCLHRFQVQVPIMYMSRQMLMREQEGTKMQQLFLSDTYIAEHPSSLSSKTNVAAPLKDNTPVFQSLIARLQGNIETV